MRVELSQCHCGVRLQEMSGCCYSHALHANKHYKDLVMFLQNRKCFSAVLSKHVVQDHIKKLHM